MHVLIGIFRLGWFGTLNPILDFHVCLNYQMIRDIAEFPNGAKLLRGAAPPVSPPTDRSVNVVSLSRQFLGFCDMDSQKLFYLPSFQRDSFPP